MPQPTSSPQAAACAVALAVALVLAGPASSDTFPRLLPLQDLLPDASAPQSRLTLDGATSLLDRATRLRSRAEALRNRQAIDPATRARIAALIARASD